MEILFLMQNFELSIVGTSNAGSIHQQNFISVNYMLILLCCLYLSTYATRITILKKCSTLTKSPAARIIKNNIDTNLNNHLNSISLTTFAVADKSNHKSSKSLSMLQLKHHLVFR